MAALESSKFCVWFCIFAFAIQARMASIRAWSFHTVQSSSKVNARASYIETETDTISIMDPPIPCKTSRRQVLSSIPKTLSASASLVFAWPTSPAFARNMPVSNGADTSKFGTVSALLPIVELRTDLASLKQTLQNQHVGKVDGSLNAITKTKTAISFTKSEENGGSSRENTSAAIPTLETDFKRLFDAYSDQVSYKQKFLDQNAFLVYYTNGYDGPGRDSLEKDPVNERQTLQFGARNEAWIGWDDFVAEWEFYSSSSRRTSIIDDADDSLLDMIKYLSNTINAVDRYLVLSPPQDLEAAQHGKSR